MSNNSNKKNPTYILTDGWVIEHDRVQLILKKETGARTDNGSMIYQGHRYYSNIEPLLYKFILLITRDRYLEAMNDNDILNLDDFINKVQEVKLEIFEIVKDWNLLEDK